jgi:hypothetical protein
VEAAVAAEYLPAGQLQQDEAPVASMYVPATQLVQTVEAVDAE